MLKISEAEAELIIEEHLREQGWDVTDFTMTRKRWRGGLDGEEADRVFLHGGKVVAILEAKKPGKDLWAALEQAKAYARTYKKNTDCDVPLLFASDGYTYLRQNLKANTFPERIFRFPTPAEFGEFFHPQALELHGTLRDYQRVAVSQVLAAVRADRRRMYLQMATGTGKTITAAGIIAKLWSVGLIRRALFLLDRDALAVQTVKKFKTHLGDNFNIERATGSKEDKHRDVLVTTIQHMAVRNKYLSYDSDHFSLVILDERYLYVLFCCQQAVEKMLKALIAKHSQDLPPRLHQLVRLAEKAQVLTSEEQANFLRELSAHYIQSRYPEEVEDVLTQLSAEQACRVVEKTEEIVRWLESML